MHRIRRWIGVLVLLGAVLVGGATYVALQGDGVENSRAGVPTDVSDDPVDADAISVEFSRPSNATVFHFNSHDPVVVNETGPASGYRLIVHNSSSRRILYRSVGDEVPTDAADWIPVQSLVNGDNPGGSIDTMVEVDGTYYAYQDGLVYTAENLTADDWEYRSDTPPGQDPGVYYDAERGLFHLFYETGNRSKHSASAIGHAVSPNGVKNWTVLPPVYNSTNGYDVGDFEIVKQDGLYLVFGDYTRDHPNYSVVVWANDDLYTNFTRVGTVMGPSANGSATRDSYGVQDADVVRVGPENRYVLFAHGHTGERGARYLHAYPGRIEIDADAVSSNGTVTATP